VPRGFFHTRKHRGNPEFVRRAEIDLFFKALAYLRRVGDECGTYQFRKTRPALQERLSPKSSQSG